MAPSDFAKANLDEVVEKLTVEEAIQLTAGVGFWHTAAIPRLDIPAVKVGFGTMLLSFAYLTYVDHHIGQRWTEW